MYEYGNDAIGRGPGLHRRFGRMIQRQFRGGAPAKKAGPAPQAAIQRSVKAKVVRNYAGGSSCEGAIGLVRTSGTTTVPVFLATETSVNLSANPGRHIGAVEIRSGGTRPDQFLTSCSLRDGDLISGSGYCNTTVLRADAPRGFFAARISPVTPIEMVVARSVALASGQTESIDLGVMVMA
jgi:hypothetical protein